MLVRGARAALALLWDSFRAWRGDQANLMSAAVAYYSLFSLAPLLIAAVSIAGLVFGDDVAQQELVRQLESVLGPDTTAILFEIIEQSTRSAAGPLASFFGVLVVIYGGSRVFHRVQMALNMIWEVEPADGIDLRRAVREQLVSFVMLIVIAALFLAMLLAGAVLGLLEGRLESVLRVQTALANSVSPIEETLSHSMQPIEETLGETLSHSIEPLEGPLGELMDRVRLTDLLDSVRSLRVLEMRLSFVVSTLLFALVFKFVPNVSVAWRDVWLGALLTAVLFAVGRLAISVYLSFASVMTAYGAAGSLVVLLLWINYSAQMLFFGAEFTKLYTRRYGSQSPLKKTGT